jgi:hypothetical protein
MRPDMKVVSGRGLYILALAILSAPSVAFAQTEVVPPSATENTYEPSGLFLHARTSGHGMAFDGPGDAEGLGLGLRAGYGVSDRFTLYLGVEGAGLDGGRGLDGLGTDEKYGVLYIELGSRFHFRPGQQLEPYADVALAVVGLGYDGVESYAGTDVTYGGAGVSLGAGLLYFLSPKFALDTGLAFMPGSLMEREAGRNNEDVDIALTSARIHVGLSVYPFR